MGGPGIAFLYARRDVAEGARPSAVGWWGVQDPFSFDVEHLAYGTGARRFEYGTPSVAAIYAARAGLSLLDEVPPRETERDRTLSRVIDQVREKFGPDALGRGPRER